MNDPENFDWNQMYPSGGHHHEPADALILEIIDPLTPGVALDVGCGAGSLVAALAQRGWETSGIDIASKGIAAARKALQERGVEATLEVADSSTWQPTRSYDLITSSFALPGTREAQARCLAMMHAAVAPGGHVLIKDFDVSMHAKQPAFAAWHLPTIEELTDAFEGFEILRAEVVPTPVHDHDGSGANQDESWSAALLHARRASA